MYMPFVRGKQFELLALKEMAVDLADSGLIWPIIEPVRTKGLALARCLDELSLFSVPATVVINPRVGDLAGMPQAAKEILQLIADRPDSTAVRLGVNVQASADVAGIRAAVASAGLDDQAIDLIHEEFAGNMGWHELVTDASYQVVSAKEVVRRYRPPLPGGHVKLSDRFPRRKTNLAYVGVEATLFTDDNVYFREDNFAGFSDYATIGEDFSEGGSSPRAVVIHLTYQGDDDAIWIRHFCSTSNDDTADTAGKFQEAVEQLVAFASTQGLRNPAIDTFARYARDGYYPGLGMVKKLSLQNHFYLLASVLRAANS